MLDAIISLAPQAVTLHPAAQSREVWLRFRGLPFARGDSGRVFFGINDAREERTPASRPARALSGIHGSRGRYAYRGHARSTIRIRASQCRGRTRYCRPSYPSGRKAPSFRVTIGCAFAGSCRAERSLAMAIFKRSLCGRPRHSSNVVAPALRFHPATDDLLKYLSPELAVARVGLCRKLAPGTARGHAPVAGAVNRPHRRNAAEFSENPAGKKPCKTLAVENCPEKERSG
jgi:hypothetical protein